MGALPYTLSLPPFVLTVLHGHVNVEVEAIFALILDVASHYLQVVGEPNGQHNPGQHAMNVLRADRSESCGIAHLRPGSGRLGRLETSLPDGRRGIRDPEVLNDGAEDFVVQVLLDPSEFAVISWHYGILVLRFLPQHVEGQPQKPEEEGGARPDVQHPKGNTQGCKKHGGRGAKDAG